MRVWFREYFSERLHVSPGSVEAYLAALVFVVVASLVRWVLGFFGETLLPFPTYHCFGSRLLSRALEQFDGAAERRLLNRMDLSTQ